MEVTANMKRIIGIGELKKYFESCGLCRILFCTENQVWSKVEDPLKAGLVFTSMATARNPNAICLKNGESSLWFERVKSVIVDSDRSPLGTVIDIICGDSSDIEDDMRYTLIAL